MQSCHLSSINQNTVIKWQLRLWWMWPLITPCLWKDQQWSQVSGPFFWGVVSRCFNSTYRGETTPVTDVFSASGRNWFTPFITIGWFFLGRYKCSEGDGYLMWRIETHRHRFDEQVLISFSLCKRISQKFTFIHKEHPNLLTKDFIIDNFLASVWIRRGPE